MNTADDNKQPAQADEATGMYMADAPAKPTHEDIPQEEPQEEQHTEESTPTSQEPTQEPTQCAGESMTWDQHAIKAIDAGERITHACVIATAAAAAGATCMGVTLGASCCRLFVKGMSAAQRVTVKATANLAARRKRSKGTAHTWRYSTIDAQM